MQSMSVTQHKGKQVRTYRKWCTYCKSHFMAQSFKGYSSRVTCGNPICQTAHSYFLNNKIRRKRFEQQKVTKVCPYCKKHFDCVGDRRVTCGKHNCMKKRNLEYNFNKKLIVKSCSVCGKVFKCCGKKRVTCGLLKCQRKRNRDIQYQKKLIVKSCSVCGKVFDCLGPGRVTCAKPKCKIKHKRAWHKMPEHRDRLEHYKERRSGLLLMHKQLESLAQI